ncbi:MAG: DNA-binding response regulator [Proteobacteria bacterium]|nr:DNA-binding response regulator [Pseudomonadota bacterium]
MSASKGKVLLVEDEPAIGETLQFNLESEGFEVDWKRDGLSAFDALCQDSSQFDAVILDLMLPHLNGFEILARIRPLAERLPILVLSARSLDSDKVKALELGADDYVTKPFSLQELMLRAHGLVRRGQWARASQRKPTDDFRLGSAEFSPASHTVKTAAGETVKITPTEMLLAQTFAQNEERVLSRNELLEQVWQYSSGTETRTVDVFVAKLRRYTDKPSEQSTPAIETVRGLGYVYKSSGKK